MKKILFILFISAHLCADQVLFLEGNSYERGVQHGKALKEQIIRNISMYIDGNSSGSTPNAFLQALPEMLPLIPHHFIEEIKGLAEGSGVSFQKLLILNLFPEMFHCSGITTNSSASKEGKLYHVRVLDYSIGKNLEETATIMVVKPEGKRAYINVSYAGFIGSVTGINDQKISIGEIGGKGYGNWKGVPMAFLMREILENAASLEDAREILQKYPRTCEYYYILADGKEQNSCAFYATPSQLHQIDPGTSYSLLAPKNLPPFYGTDGTNDKFFLSGAVKTSPHQTVMYDEKGEVVGIFHSQLDHTLSLTGFSHPERYPTLVERMEKHYGEIGAQVLQEIIKAPVSRSSNLHNVIFCPEDMQMWVSHANEEIPACDNFYTLYDVEDLLLK